ncbi:hypothetical protein IDH31_00645, partial [Pelagibacterales bacterium SAG-MED32]|nr:hypothetical protein [Pelagibacterales bacterium SAG-MED32]
NYFNKPNYRVEIDLKQNNYSEIFKYKYINNIINNYYNNYNNLRLSLGADNEQIVLNDLKFTPVSETGLFKALLVHLSKKENLVKSYLNIKGIDNFDEVTLKMNSEKFSNINVTEKDNKFELQFTISEYNDLKNIINNYIRESNSAAIEDIIKNLNNIKEDMTSDKVIRIARIEREIENIKNTYEDEIKARILYLKEQAHMARERGIETEKFSNSSGLMPLDTDIEDLNMNLPYYFLGYRSIENEISIIQKRDLNENPSHSQKYVDANRRKNALMSDNTIDLLDTSIKEFENDFEGQDTNFQLLIFSESDLKLDATGYPKIYIFLVTVVISIFVSAFLTVFISNYFRFVKKKGTP